MGTLKEHMGRLEEAMAEMSRLSAESSAKLDRQIAETNRKWGELANKMGTLVEDIVAPGLPAVFEQIFGIPPEEWAQRVWRRHRQDPGRNREFDFVATAERVMLVNETKSELWGEDIRRFVGALKDIRGYLREADDRVVVGCLAAFSMHPTLVRAGERQGLIMAGLGTGLLQALNTPGFVPRRF